MTNATRHEGGCHCGAVRFSVTTDLTQVIACNCSHCSKKGFLLTFVSPDQFDLHQGADRVTEYRFNTHKIRHLFCATCGVQSYGEGVGPDGREMRAINVRCLDDVQLDTLRPIPWDGASH